MKRVTMELGGHAPAIIFEDADLDAAAKILAANKYRNAGQVCVAPTRLLVQRKVYDSFVEKFITASKKVKVGDGLESGATMGPLAHDRRLDRVPAPYRARSLRAAAHEPWPAQANRESRHLRCVAQGWQRVDAIASAEKDAALYPEPSSDQLRERLAARLGIAPARLAFGNGSEDLIAVCAQAFLAPGHEMLTIAPSFGLHPIYAQAAGATVRAVRVRDDYSIDVPGILDALTPLTRMLMFSAPSNPAGTTISAVELSSILSALDSQTLLILDEAYFEYASEAPGYGSFLQVLNTSSVSWILLRTFSKTYGLAGLRVGYGIASEPSLIDIIDRVRMPFDVNRLAQAGAVATIEETKFVRDCVLKTITERERVAAELATLGYRTAPSVANFLFFDARQDANAFSQRLLKTGVIVKPWREPGFETHVRASIGSPRSNDQFLAAVSRR